MRRLLLVAAVLGVALAVAGGAQARVVPGQYIVVLKPDTRSAVVANVQARASWLSTAPRSKGTQPV